MNETMFVLIVHFHFPGTIFLLFFLLFLFSHLRSLSPLLFSPFTVSTFPFPRVRLLVTRLRFCLRIIRQ